MTSTPMNDGEKLRSGDGNRPFDPPGNGAARRAAPSDIDAALRAALATLRKTRPTG